MDRRKGRDEFLPSFRGQHAPARGLRQQRLTPRSKAVPIIAPGPGQSQ
ncbi:MAG: hypothetical protein IMW96_01380 [Thermoanaerobacteraceae bacterium]|nr:hypothetical protein [Thermoanaerobacteraceae bacterium]